jgi:hypothetical protein
MSKVNLIYIGRKLKKFIFSKPKFLNSLLSLKRIYKKYTKDGSKK